MEPTDYDLLSVGSFYLSTLSDRTLIVSGALLVIGAILTFTGANVPLGIGLMISSDTRSTMLTTYIFCDADRNEFALNVISTTKVFDLNMELTNGLFDHSKLDSNNPDAGIWETSKAVLRK